MTQHTNLENPGKSLIDDSEVTISEDLAQLKTIKELPHNYSYVSPAVLRTEYPSPPVSVNICIPDTILIESDNRDSLWLTKTYEIAESDILDPQEFILWSAYNANEQKTAIQTPAITGMLPMFRENAHTLAMVKHGMDVIKKQHIMPIPDRSLYLLLISLYMLLQRKSSGHGQMNMVKISMLCLWEDSI